MEGTREISNSLYTRLAIIPQHQPRIWDIGDQRDPEPVVNCSCQMKSYPYLNKKEDFRTGAWNFTEHLIEVLDREFNLGHNE